jgi:Ras-related protein Rab-8A
MTAVNMYSHISTHRGYDLLIKILTIGDSAVGKTCLLMRYAADTFSPTFITTIGIDFKVKYADVDGRRIKLQLWDTAGQERFRSITSSYFRGAQGAILVYDVTNPDSFQHVLGWLEDLDKAGIKKECVFLVANKIDVEGQRLVGAEAGAALAAKYKLRYFECSAKTGAGVEELFERVARDVSSGIFKADRVEHHATTIQKAGVDKKAKCC